MKTRDLWLRCMKGQTLERRRWTEWIHGLCFCFLWMLWLFHNSCGIPQRKVFWDIDLTSLDSWWFRMQNKKYQWFGLTICWGFVVANAAFFLYIIFIWCNYGFGGLRSILSSQLGLFSSIKALNVHIAQIYKGRFAKKNHARHTLIIIPIIHPKHQSSVIKSYQIPSFIKLNVSVKHVSLNLLGHHKKACNSRRFAQKHPKKPKERSTSSAIQRLPQHWPWLAKIAPTLSASQSAMAARLLATFSTGSCLKMKIWGMQVQDICKIWNVGRTSDPWWSLTPSSVIDTIVSIQTVVNINCLVTGSVMASPETKWDSHSGGASWSDRSDFLQRPRSFFKVVWTAQSPKPRKRDQKCSKCIANRLPNCKMKKHVKYHESNMIIHVSMLQSTWDQTFFALETPSDSSPRCHAQGQEGQRFWRRGDA